MLKVCPHRYRKNRFILSTSHNQTKNPRSDQRLPTHQFGFHLPGCVFQAAELQEISHEKFILVD